MANNEAMKKPSLKEEIAKSLGIPVEIVEDPNFAVEAIELLYHMCKMAKVLEPMTKPQDKYSALATEE